jgi:hypothetical protein
MSYDTFPFSICTPSANIQSCVKIVACLHVRNEMEQPVSSRLYCGHGKRHRPNHCRDITLPPPAHSRIFPSSCPAVLVALMWVVVTTWQALWADWYKAKWRKGETTVSREHEALSAVIPTARGTSFRGFSVIQLHDELKPESVALRTGIVSCCVSNTTTEVPQGSPVHHAMPPPPMSLFASSQNIKLKGFLGQPLSDWVTILLPLHLLLYFPVAHCFELVHAIMKSCVLQIIFASFNWIELFCCLL